MIVIFGGAFNPPTIAHKEIYYHVLKFIPFTEFVFLPVSSLYTKRSLASNFHRLQMLNLLIKDLPNSSISTLEFDDSDYIGTYQSLLRIQEKYPNQELSFIIGADNLIKIHKWINAKALLTDFKFIVINRSLTDMKNYIQNDLFLKEYSSRFVLLPDFNLDISSTAFRETFDQKIVTKEIYQYIQIQGLYRG